MHDIIEQDLENFSGLERVIMTEVLAKNFDSALGLLNNQKTNQLSLSENAAYNYRLDSNVTTESFKDKRGFPSIIHVDKDTWWYKPAVSLLHLAIQNADDNNQTHLEFVAKVVNLVASKDKLSLSMYGTPTPMGLAKLLGKPNLLQLIEVADAEKADAKKIYEDYFNDMGGENNCCCKNTE